MNVEYTDLHRFLTSIGIVLTAIPFIFLWLIFTSQFDLMIDKDTLAKLTDQAQEILGYRQKFVAFWVLNWWIPLGIAVIGILLTGLGLSGWRRKQKFADAVEEAKAKRDIQDMSGPEIVEKAKNEIELEKIGELRGGGPGVAVPQVTVSEIEEYMAVEKTVIDKMYSCISGKYRRETEFKIENIRFDCAFWPHSKMYSALVLDVKRQRFVVERNALMDRLQQSQLALQAYWIKVKHKTKIIVVFVVPGEHIGNYESMFDKNVVVPDWLPHHEDMLVVFTSEENLESINCNDIAGWFPQNEPEKWLLANPLPTSGYGQPKYRWPLY